MDIQKMRVFLAVVDAGSFSKAAENLGYTQAGVSYVVNALEKEFDMTLFERNAGGARLTSNGRALIDDISNVVDAGTRLEGVVAARKAGQHSTLRIAAIDSAATRWLPDAVRAFRPAFPDIQLDILTGDPFEINAWIRKGSADIGLSERAWIEDGLAWMPLIRDPYFGAFPPGEAPSGTCSAADFAGKHVFIPDYRRDRNVSLLLRGIRLDLLHDRLGTAAILRLVGMGSGVSIVTALATEIFSLPSDTLPAPVLVPFRPAAWREIGVVALKGQQENTDVRAFVRVLQTAMQDDQERYVSYLTQDG